MFHTSSVTGCPQGNLSVCNTSTARSIPFLSVWPEYLFCSLSEALWLSASPPLPHIYASLACTCSTEDQIKSTQLSVWMIRGTLTLSQLKTSMQNKQSRKERLFLRFNARRAVCGFGTLVLLMDLYVYSTHWALLDVCVCSGCTFECSLFTALPGTVLISLFTNQVSGQRDLMTAWKI